MPAGAPIQWAKPHNLAVTKGRPNQVRRVCAGKAQLHTVEALDSWVEVGHVQLYMVFTG